MSQLQILIVSDTYCLSHIFLKAQASARSFLKWFCLKLQKVKHLIMFATFHGCHTHLWESPHGFESGTIKWRTQIRISRRREHFFSFPHSAQDIVTLPEKVVLPPYSRLRMSALLASEIHDYSWAGVVSGT